MEVSEIVEQEWFVEESVQAAILDYMKEEEGLTILSAGQPGASQGVEIVAERTVEERVVHRLVTVRGWPSQAQQRGTQPSQARTMRPEAVANGWMAQTIFDLVLSRGADPDLELALALPTIAAYIRYVQRLRWFFSVSRISLYLVSQDGRVAVTPPGAAPVNVFATNSTAAPRRKLGLPGATRLQLPLLHALINLGGTARRSDAIINVANWFPEVPQPPSAEFGQRLSIAQNSLQDEGLTEPAGRGVWRITEAGRLAHNAQWDDWLRKAE